LIISDLILFREIQRLDEFQRLVFGKFFRRVVALDFKLIIIFCQELRQIRQQTIEEGVVHDIEEVDPAVPSSLPIGGIELVILGTVTKPLINFSSDRSLCKNLTVDFVDFSNCYQLPLAHFLKLIAELI